jgi:hypothetical protein
LRTPEYPEKTSEIPGFSETPEKIPETPGLLLVTPKAVKKIRNRSNKKFLPHIQEFVKVFNEVILLTTFMEASVEG